MLRAASAAPAPPPSYPRQGMTRYRLVGAAALAIVATGCAAAPGEPPKTVLAWAPEPTKAVRNLILPYDHYQLSVNEIYLIESAQDLLTRDCMKKRGYDWEVIGDRKRYADLRNRRRYGVIEMPVARQMGYRANDRLLGSTDVTVQKMDREKRLSPEARGAALDPADGCDKLSYLQLAKGNQEDENLVNNLNYRSLQDAYKSPRVVSVMRNWSRCMAEKGYRYKDVNAVDSDPRWAKGRRPSAAEKRAAVADVSCKERFGLVKVLSDTERAIQERGIRQHKTYFERLASAKERYLAAARAVLRRH
ncbi:hypothetical protein [Streptomyces sp. NPDC048710]|uniref:hypothetical protein n=1 Tax=unclassified Streptomyces TaxID=2593676 RepID=UPI003714CED5